MALRILVLTLPIAIAMADWVPLGSTPFGKRFAHGTIADADGRIIVAGGADSMDSYSGHWFNDAWVLEKGTWYGLPASTWSPRGDFGFAAFPNGTIVVAGGQQQDEMGHPATCDVHVLHKGARNWEQMPDPPWCPKRVGHHMTACPDGSIIMTGGAEASPCIGCKVYEDVWRLSPSGAWSLITDKAPWGTRWLHRTVCLSDGSLIFSGGDPHGGHWPTGDLNDVWRMSPSGEFKQLQASAPWKPRRMFMMSAGPNNIIAVAGGCGRGDTWTMTGAAASSKVALSFHQQQQKFPFDSTGERWWAGMAALPNNTHVLVGGMNQPNGREGDYGDVWMLPGVGERPLVVV